MMLDKISERLQQFDVLCIVEDMTLKQKNFFATLQCYTALNDERVEEVSL